MKYFKKGLSLTQVVMLSCLLFTSCSKDDDLVIDTNTDTNIEANSATITEHVSRDNFLSAYRNSEDKVNFLLNSQDKIAEKLDESLVRGFVAAEDKAQFLKDNVHKFKESRQSDILKLADRTISEDVIRKELGLQSKYFVNSKSDMGYITMDNTDMQILSEFAPVDYNSTSFVLERFGDVNDELRGFTDNTRDPYGVYVNETRYEGPGHSGLTNPNTANTWECKYKFNINSITSSSFTNLVNSTPVGPYRIIPGAAIVTKENTNSERRVIPFDPIILVNERSVSITNSHTISIDVGAKFEAGVVFAKGETSINLGYAYTNARATGNMYQVRQTITDDAELDPLDKVTFIPAERRLRVQYDIKTPIQFDGYLGSDYGGGQYHGHHFYAVSANSFFSEISGNNDIGLTVNEDFFTEIQVFKVIKDRHGNYKTLADLLTGLTLDFYSSWGSYYYE